LTNSPAKCDEAPRARAQKGLRAKTVGPFQRGPNVSAIAALGLRRVCAPMIEGAINTETFDQYVEHLLVPVLRARDIVLLDNVKCHYSDRAIDLIEAAGAGALHAPAIRRTSIQSRNVFQRSSRSYAR
jgi:hypothetical protein